MTIRTLFNIILKILGILFIKDILAIIPELISIVFYLKKPDVEGALWTLVMLMVTLSAYGLAAYYFIFRSGYIIDKLKLEEGFDEDTVTFTIHRSTVLSIAIIVIGGIMVADEIPNLCRQLFTYFQEKKMTFGQANPSLTLFVLPAVKILIGLLLIGNQRQLVNAIELHRKR